MRSEDVLNNLLDRNNALKSVLINEQLKSNSYSFNRTEKYLLKILHEYKQHKSLFKASLNQHIDLNIIMKCYIQGQMGNPKFRGFFLAINELNDGSEINIIENDSQITKTDEIEIGEYKISEYGDGWSYTTYVDGEKIFIISNELDSLKSKVKNKHLPLD